MNISEVGLDLIKEFESCRLEAYRDVGGIWTIGWGSTRGVGEGDVITQEEADRRLLGDLQPVEKCIANCVSGQITQNQYDALCCFIFNIGCGAFRNSTLLKKLNDGDDEGAAAEFVRWDKVRGEEVAGLLRRRQAERDLFIS